MAPNESIRATPIGAVVACLVAMGLALAACGSAGSSPTATQSSASSQTLEMHLILDPVNDTVGSLAACSSPGGCQGDFMIGYDPLLDATTNEQVGTFAYECFLVDVASFRYHCPGVTISLTGRGEIVFTEVIEHKPGRPPAIAPITGGTGEFLGATGIVTVKVVPGGGDLVIAITK
jgi:hypothetical protein